MTLNHTFPKTGRRSPRWRRRVVLSLVAPLAIGLAGVPAAASGYEDDLALRFVEGRHPAGAEKDTTITSVQLDPAGASIQVEIVDEEGNRVVDEDAAAEITIAIADNPVDGTLSGALTQPTVDGVATFGDLQIDAPGFGYSLRADADRLMPTTSDAFIVYDDTCADGELCSATAGTEGAGLQATARGVGGVGPGGLLAVLDTDAPQCAGDHSRIPETVLLVGTNVVDSVVEFRVSKEIDQQQPNNGVAHYQVCTEPLDEASEFVDRDGRLVKVGEAGLLRDCRNMPLPPCVQSKTKASGADVLITVRWGSQFKMR